MPYQIAHVEGLPLDPNKALWPIDFAALRPREKTAIICDDRILTYGDLESQSNAFVTLAEQWGFTVGDRVAYLGRNSELYFVAWFGCLKAGLVIVPMNWRNTASELQFVLEDSEAKLLICDAEFEATAREAMAGRDVLLVRTNGEDTTHDLRRLVTSAPEAPRRFRDPDMPCAQVYTSGTTGRPKGVLMTHRTFAMSRMSEVSSPNFVDWSDDETILCAMPCFHMGGMSWVLCGMVFGATCVLTSDTSTDAFIELCNRYCVTRVFIVPTALRTVIDDIHTRCLDVPKLSSICYGASLMDVPLLLEVQDTFGCRLLNNYGMTEAAGTMVTLGPDDHDPARPHLLASVGTPNPGNALEIRRPDLSICDVGEPGEIWLTGPTIMPGYWQRPEATAEAIVDGWYRTGDGGYVDADGFLFLTDRIRDMIVSGGENVYPAEVENALRSHVAVRDVGVFAIPDPKWGEIVAAAVETYPGEEVSEAQLREHAVVLLSRFKVPKRFIIGVSLPRTASGKVQRAELRRLFRPQTGCSPPG
jgi:acyl-CoA synthetase (AMP-forming)/AMP-acid ligase II